MSKKLKVIAKTFFVLSFIFFVIFFIAQGIFSGDYLESGIPTQILIIFVSFLVMMVGFIISFKDEKIGGLIIFAGGVFNVAYLLSRGEVGNYEAAGIFGLPYVIVGIIIISSEKKGLRF